jgi:outer membrane lipoprotein LolB
MREHPTSVATTLYTFCSRIHFRLIIAVALLASCSTPPKELHPIANVGAVWENRKARLYEMQSWGMTGRIAVRIENKGWQAGLHWRQQEENYDLDLLDPFGRVIAKLKGRPAGVILTTVKGEHAWASNPEALMKKLLGYSFPVSGLGYWMRGIPDPHIDVETLRLDTAGRLSELKQSGWQVEYQRYQDAIDLTMPAKLTLVNPGIKVKLVVNTWQLNAP